MDVQLRSDRIKASLLCRPRLYRGIRWVWLIGRYVLRRPHSPQFAAFSLFPERTGLFLDVGANDGTSAMSFRIHNRTAPILSIEANPDHTRALRNICRLVGNASFRIMAAGATHGTAELSIPYCRGVPLTAMSSLDEDSQQSTLEWWAEKYLGHADLSQFEYRRIEVDVVPLDSLELSPDFVKLDVEGFEFQVLQGLRHTIERSHPVIMAEVSETDGETQDLLGELGYVARRFDPQAREMIDIEGTAGSTVFFLPDRARVNASAFTISELPRTSEA